MPDQRGRPHRQRKRFSTRKKDRPQKTRASLRLDPQLKKVFQQIGVPEARPFQPDPFQLEALLKLEHHDVIVSAPTGSGKTWIASQAIRTYLSRGLRTWYASPLKALSNSIYHEFNRTFGAGCCGILTGDRKENPDASIVVGTTEILRNQLYDAMQSGVNIQTDLVILDEAHYLSDPDRGVVWEETLIYLPARVRLLLLSATISNAREVCAWLAQNRGVAAQVVLSDRRPVPLETLFLFPDGLLSPLGGPKGILPRVKNYLSSPGARSRSHQKTIPYHQIIETLRDYDLLPAIFFLKSRADCDMALQDCLAVRESEEIQERLRSEIHLFLERYPHLKGHRQIRPMLQSLVAAHHAGQLPYWKVLVETMMNKSYLDAIFSTSTVAAGVNFPARTVVLVQSDRFNGREFSDLTATELHQMTGRAGRRGKDKIGFALVVPGRHQDPQLIQDLKDSPPEPLKSQIRINVSMTLNLLLSHRPLEIRDLLQRSFASFQEKQIPVPFRKYWESHLQKLQALLPHAACDGQDPYEILENIRRRQELHIFAGRSARRKPSAAELKNLTSHLFPGGLFRHRNKNVYLILNTMIEKGRLICLAHPIQKPPRLRKGRLHGKRVDVHQITSVYDFRLEGIESDSLEKAQERLASIPLADLKMLPMDSDLSVPGKEEADAQVRRLSRIPCGECVHAGICHSKEKGELKKWLHDLEGFTGQLEHVPGGLWLSFKRHLRLLKETGFVNEADRLTDDGIWASQLRLDQPLLIGEAIRQNGFQGLAPEFVAGCLAPFVWDRAQDVDFSGTRVPEYQEMIRIFKQILEKIAGIRDLMETRGFESPRIFYWPAVALYIWAKGTAWKELLQIIPLNEGDLASLIVRTADHLRQVAGLKATHPALATQAFQAIGLIMREPVLIE